MAKLDPHATCHSFICDFFKTHRVNHAHIIFKLDFDFVFNRYIFINIRVSNRY